VRGDDDDDDFTTLTSPLPMDDDDGVDDALTGDDDDDDDGWTDDDDDDDDCSTDNDDDEDNDDGWTNNSPVPPVVIVIGVARDANVITSLLSGRAPANHLFLSFSCCAWERRLQGSGFQLGARSDVRSVFGIILVYTQMSLCAGVPSISISLVKAEALNQEPS